MPTYTVDTAAAIRKLKDAECAEPLAEAIVGLVAEREEELATKADIHALEGRLEGSIHALKAELKGDIRALEAKMGEQKSQLTTRMWIVVTSIVALSKAWDYFFPIASSF